MKLHDKARTHTDTSIDKANTVYRNGDLNKTSFEA